MRRGAFFVRGLCAVAVLPFGALAAVAATAATGCSGADGSALFASAGDDGAGSGVKGGVTPGQSIDAGSVARDAASAPADANVAPPEDATTPFDSGPVAQDPPDAGEPPENLGVRCGLSRCSPGTDVCCRIPGGANDSFACLPGSTCAVIPGALSIPCDDATDCAAGGHPGGICCASLDPQTGEANAIACAAPQACTSTMQTNLCATNAPAPCPNGGTCKISQTTIPGYDICF